MMRRIVAASLKARGLVIVGALVLIVVGVLQFRSMPRDVLPEFSRPTVDVQTEALGLAAEEVEQLITVPLEQDLLNGVAFLDTIRSQSVPGLSRIELVFKQGTDLARARQIVNERLTQAAALPHVSAPPQMLQPLSSQSRLMMIRLSSTSQSLNDLGVLARWTIRPRLMGVSGVADVAIWGQRERQIQVQVSPSKLQDQGVALEQVIATTGNALWWSPIGRLEANTPGTGGFIDGPQQRLGIFHESPIKTPDDLAKVTLESTGEAGAPSIGPSRVLGDVSTLVADHQPLIGDAVFGDGNGLLLVVEKLPEANVAKVTKAVDDALDEMRPGLTGVSVDSSIYRPARYVQSAIGNVVAALIAGVVLLVAAMVILLFEWRAPLISAISIAVSMLTAVVVLDARGVTLNAMVLAGLLLAVAVIVDDVVVITENVRRRLRQHHPDLGATHEAAVVHSTLETRGPVLYATVIALLALVPVVALHGEMGAFIPPIAYSYAIAVVVALIIAITVTPLLSLVAFRGRTLSHRESPIINRLGASYERLSPRLVNNTRLAFGTFAVMALVGLVALPFTRRGDSLVPTFKDRSIIVQWDGAPGTSLAEMSRITARASQELKSLPGVEGVGAHVGRAVGGDQIVGASSGEMWLTMASTADYGKTLSSIKSVIAGYPGLGNKVLSYPTKRIEEVLDGSNRDLTVRVFGDDLTVINDKATEVSTALGSIKGVKDPRVRSAPTEPTLRIKVNLDAAQAAGIKPGDVRRAATTLVSGLTVGALFEEQKVFDVVVIGTPDVRANVSAIRDLIIDSPTGRHVRLADVADVSVAPGLSVIRHEDVSRYVDVDATVSGRSIGAVANDVNKALKQISFPLQHRAQLLRDYATSQQERRGFIALCVAAIIGIFLLFQNAFRSWRLAAVTFLALPSALAGGMVGALVVGRFSIGSIVGFLALFAIAARSTMLLIGRYREAELHEPTIARRDLVLDGTRQALVPLVGAAVGTGFALSPLVVFGNRPGFEIAHRLAVVVVCGLVTVTLFSLIVVPAMYLRFGRRAVADDIDDLLHERGFGAVAAGPIAVGVGVAGTSSPNGEGAGNPSTNGPPTTHGAGSSAPALTAMSTTTQSDTDGPQPTGKDDR